MTRLLAAAGALAASACGQGLFPPEQLERLRAGLRDVYSLEYDRAEQNFQRMIDEASDDPAGYTYLAWTYWVRELGLKQELSIDRFAASDFFAEVPKYQMRVDPAVEARFRRMSELAIEKARARLDKNPGDRAAQYLLGVAYQNLASFEASLKRNWWAAFRHGSRTYRYHRELLRQDPNFHDARLAIGVYQYVAGSLGWSVKWVAFLMGYRGSKERGKQELQTAVEKGSLAPDDARVILTLIHTRERNYRKAFDYLTELLRKYPQNYLVHLDMGGMALLLKQPEAAVEIYQDILRRQEAGMARYSGLERASVFNRLGVALRQKGDFRESAAWLEKALGDAAASARSRTIARLELGKTLDLLGRRQDAREQYQVVAQAEDIAGSRQEAQDLLRRPYRR
jgi:tetratricopeptide (TPR) repeat protein